jgi:hypothetical protein
VLILLGLYSGYRRLGSSGPQFARMMNVGKDNERTLAYTPLKHLLHVTLLACLRVLIGMWLLSTKEGAPMEDEELAGGEEI